MWEVIWSLYIVGDNLREGRNRSKCLEEPASTE